MKPRKMTAAIARKMVIGDEILIREGDEERARLFIREENERRAQYKNHWPLILDGSVVRCVSKQ